MGLIITLCMIVVGFITTTVIIMEIILFFKTTKIKQQSLDLVETYFLTKGDCGSVSIRLEYIPTFFGSILFIIWLNNEKTIQIIRRNHKSWKFIYDKIKEKK